MASYDELLREYQEYIEEKKALAAIAGSAALAIGGAHFMNKDAKAAETPAASSNASSEDPLWGEGDWAYQGDQEAETPSDHDEDPAEEPQRQVQFTKADLDVLSMTLWGEARSEGAKGMRAVAHVIVNRAAHPSRWADTVRGAAREDRQFSCWNEGDPNRAKMPKMLEFYNYLKAKPKGWQQWYEAFKKSPDYAEFQKYLEARRIALDVLQGNSDDPTGGALFYHTDSVSPNWAQGQQVIARVGAHQFYRTDRKA